MAYGNSHLARMYIQVIIRFFYVITRFGNTCTPLQQSPTLDSSSAEHVVITVLETYTPLAIHNSRCAYISSEHHVIIRVLETQSCLAFHNSRHAYPQSVMWSSQFLKQTQCLSVHASMHVHWIIIVKVCMFKEFVSVYMSKEIVSTSGQYGLGTLSTHYYYYYYIFMSSEC